MKPVASWSTMLEKDEDMDFVIVGAGAIGSWVGVLLHSRTRFKVCFLVPDNTRGRFQVERLSATGLTALAALDVNFFERVHGREAARLITTDEGVLDRCKCVLVCTKRPETGKSVSATLRRALARRPRGRPPLPCLLLQNGLATSNDLDLGPAEGRGALTPIEAVVDFNTVLDAASGTVTLMQAMEHATLVLGTASPLGAEEATLLHAIAEDLCEVNFPDQTRQGVAHVLTVRVMDSPRSFQQVQRGKLLLNLTNAVNALCGLGIGVMYRDLQLRQVLAASMREADAVFRAEKLPPSAPAPRDRLKLRWLPFILDSLPQWLFLAVAGSNFKGREAGRTSMAQDLDARRVPTEIEYLNGDVARRALRLGVATPVNNKLIDLMKEAESLNQGCPNISADRLWELTLGAEAPGKKAPARSPTSAALQYQALLLCGLSAAALGVALAARRKLR